jgi:hypothetical protein
VVSARGRLLVLLALVQTCALAAPARAQVIIAGGGVSTGGIIAIDSGTCPSGFTELTSARGRFLVGTPSGGTLAGTAGSAMTDLQNPSVTPTFNGSALATHQHNTGTDSSSSGTQIVFSNNPFGQAGATGFGSVNTSSVSGGINAALTSAVSGGTPAGTVSAVASNSLAPYLQLTLCKKS